MNKFYLTLFLLFFSQLNSVFATVGILPVKIRGINSRTISKGPKLLPGRKQNPWELAKILYLVLKVGKMNDVVSPNKLRAIWKSSKLSLNRKLTKSNLRNLATQLDVETLLIPSLQKIKRGYQLESKIYYVSTGLITHTKVTRGNNLWKLFSLHLSNRYRQLHWPKLTNKNLTRPILLLLDASGRNYYEIKQLSHDMTQIQTPLSAVCSTNGKGQFSYSKLNSNIKSTAQFIRKLSVSGGDNYLRSFSKAIDCIDRLNKYKGYSLDKPDVITLVSSKPKSSQDEIRLRAKFRKVLSRANVLIFLGGNSSLQTRNFWKNLVEDLKSLGKIEFHDILYQQKVGLISGDQWNIFKRGYHIIESKKSSLSNEEAILVPSHLKEHFTPKNLQKIYQQLSQNNVVSRNKVQIKLLNSISRFHRNKNIAQSSEKIYRVLLEINKKPFWVSLPESSIKKNGKLKILKGKKYYFLLNLIASNAGNPFKNSPNFAKVFSSRGNLSRLLLLDINSYLSRPSRYLSHSIGGSSLYLFFAKVKFIRVASKDAYANE